MAVRLAKGTLPSLFLLITTLGKMADGHDHHGESAIPEGQTVSLEPLVSAPSAPIAS